jgi:pSer/pThr/pTyr-binding forkhead associated (FHA) protein
MELYKLRHLKNDLELVIEDASSIVGRSDNCDLKIESSNLSREHARIHLRNGEVSVQDLHSTNGTFVNERQIFEETPIKVGDVVRFGQERFALQSETSDATVMFDQKSLGKLADSAMMVEDEEEADGTVMLQSISLPVGWDKADDLEDEDDELNPQDQKLVVALQAHAVGKLKHPHGLVATVIPASGTPLVKLLSTAGENASWTLGREQGADLLLEDPTVSHHHATVFFLDGDWCIKDNDSRNGLFQSGAKLSELKIDGKAKLELGPFKLRFKVVDKSV